MKPIVLITGSSRGIGLALAKTFAREGYFIILNGREDEAALAEAEAALHEITDDVMAFLADVSDAQKVQEMMQMIYTSVGFVDVLINNAGMEYFGLFQDMDTNDILNIISHNLMNTLYMSHQVVPNMIAQKRGHIINISSIWGAAGASCEAVYSAAKAGIHGFTKALAKELGPSNIRVNAIACGAIDTRMNARLSMEEKQQFIDEIPLGRFGTPEDVADLALTIVKASYLTGQVVHCDGGYL